jgi:hypothetical protein
VLDADMEVARANLEIVLFPEFGQAVALDGAGGADVACSALLVGVPEHAVGVGQVAAAGSCVGQGCVHVGRCGQ